MKRLAFFFAGAIALGAARAAAQSDASQDAASAITSPVPREPAHVAYPPGAEGDAAVVLELVVDKEGRVGSATLVNGEGAFAQAALAAASGWTFEPARRAGVAVPARILFEVKFHAPVVPVVSEGNDAAGGPAAPVRPAASANRATPGAASEPGVAEVLVRGARAEVGVTRLGAAEVRQIPGAFGDAFRAIEALPGVTPIVSGLPFFFVRGAPPGNIGYFIDGVRVPLLYHLALGPSVIHPDLIDHVEFYPGGYPARFGRYSGAILDGETRPEATRPHADANIRVFDSGALVEAPMLDGRLTALVAGRYSYSAALVQLIAKDTRVAYWDYQTRITYELNPRDRISVFWFGSFDEIDTRDRQSVYDGGRFTGETLTPFYPVFKTEFHRIDLRYDHDTARGHLRLAATLGVEDSLAGSQSQATSVLSRSLEIRSEGEERLARELKLRYGADVLLYRYSLDTGSSSALDLQSLYPSRNDVMIGARADVIWKAGNRVEVVPGLRLDLFTSRLAGPTSVAGPPPPPPDMPTQFRPQPDMTAPIPGGLTSATAMIGVDPRVATRVAASSQVTWVTTFGVAHQPPSLVVPVPGLTIGRLNTGLQTSLQASQGVEVALPLDVTLTVTGFLHHYLGLTDATATCIDARGNVASASNDCLAERVRGRAFGLELLAKRDLTKRLTGWISYTLSRSTRQTHGLAIPGTTSTNFAAATATVEDIPAEFDRTHVVNVIGAYDLGAGWRAGARFMFYTGLPYSPQVQGSPVPPFNSERLPPFYRIDFRLEKRWHAFGRGYLSFVLEGMNVTLHKEAVFPQCNPDGTLVPYRPDTCTPLYIGPVSVPSIGLEGGI